MVSGSEKCHTFPGFSGDSIRRKISTCSETTGFFPFTLPLHILMGLADHPMGVVGEARLIIIHTRTHIQKNILIFGADELETYVSPQNWKPKQSCLSAWFYVLLLAKKSMMNIHSWKNECYIRVVLTNALSSPMQLSEWHRPPSRQMVRLLYSCSWVMVPRVCESPGGKHWFQMPQALSTRTEILSAGRA